jgi:hypothetical protein
LTASGLSDLQQCLHHALTHVEPNGTFRADHGQALRECLAETAPVWRLPAHPAALFGPWESLSNNAQSAFRRAVEAEITRAMRFHPRGALWPGLIGGWLTVDRALERRNLAPQLRNLGGRWASRAWDGPARFAELAHRRRGQRNWRVERRVTVDDLLATLGRQPRWLIGDFVAGVRVDPRCRGVHWQRDRNVGFGQIVGVDLIPAEHDTWCVEANVSTAFNETRRAVLNPEPSVEVVFREAAEAGMRHIVWQEMEWSEVRVWLLAELRKAAARYGMTIDIQESHRIPRRDDLPSSVRAPTKFTTTPTMVPERTLVVRRNCFPVGSDYLISNKGAFVRGVGRALIARQEAAVRVPEMVTCAAEVFREPQPGLPNLVYKYPDLEKGEGVFFLRSADSADAERLAREIDAETGEPPGLFQPFVCSRLLEGRRVYDVRCELLITPRGARHIFSIRRESSQSVPESLEYGRVRSAGVFTSNLATGGKFAPVDPAEADQVREAALAVGEALVESLNETFDTGHAP